MTNYCFRKAGESDIAAIEKIYLRTHDAEEAGLTTIGWIRSIYPTRATAEAALERGDLYVCEANWTSSGPYGEPSDEYAKCQDEAAKSTKQIVATAIINQLQVDVYADVKWENETPDDKVSVLHTLVVDPEARFGGVGKAFVRYWEESALAEGCTELRMDTNERNAIARAFYAKLGYREVGVVPTVFNGIPGVNLVMLEKAL